MAITLAQAKVDVNTEIQQTVIDAFQRESEFINILPFVNVVVGTTSSGRTTMSYSWPQVKTPATAAVRDINEEYTPAVALDELKTIELAILGGTYEIDRVIGLDTDKLGYEITKQEKSLVKAAVNKFLYLMVNADKTTNPKEKFDGLKLSLTGTDTAFTSTVDVSGDMTEAKAESLINEIDKVALVLERDPDVILANKATMLKIKQAAKKQGYYSREKNDFGKKVASYGESTMLYPVDTYWNGTASAEIIPDGTIYMLCLGEDEFTGVTLADVNLFIQTVLPNFKENAESVRKGMVEMIAGVALKNTRAAAMVSGITITA